MKDFKDYVSEAEADLALDKELNEMNIDTLQSYIDKADAKKKKLFSDAKKRGEKMWGYSPNNTAPLRKDNVEYNKLDKDIRKAQLKLSAAQKAMGLVKPSNGKGTFGTTRGYGQDRYMGD